MSKRVLAISLIGAATASLLAFAQPAAAASQCFFANNWNGGWKATPDSKAIYIRVGVNKLYRLDLSSSCPELQQPDAHLINRIRGSSTLCSALDFDLSVSVGHGFTTPCIVSKLTPLSDAEAAALPKNLRP
jgi:hypothetical protein